MALVKRSCKPVNENKRFIDENENEIKWRCDNVLQFSEAIIIPTVGFGL